VGVELQVHRIDQGGLRRRGSAVVVALGVEDCRLDIVDGDERSTAVKRRVC